ncbi:cell division cycle-associated protein 4 isoform X2 [Denticeps clupeoides]|uniref:cell division cycle-associated protein 4 isoform X2 n=1 Tax=Denticeps clupeoides TaxID=299321 RepID=UPI0010A4B156|nr:cell division cycle-associated protein 4-like isoform X2 [Denticeps clupeoides]
MSACILVFVSTVLGCHYVVRLLPLWLAGHRDRSRPAMFSKGTKRKFSDGEDEMPDDGLAGAKVASSAYSLQRQSLLDMSLIKLQLCHMLVEPNLCRSVLIANTVRQIQEEMTHDGSWQVVSDSLGVEGSPSERLVATEVLCRSPSPSSTLSEQELERDTEPRLYSLVSYDDSSCREEEVVAEVIEDDNEALCSEAASNVCLSGTMSHCWEPGELRVQQNNDDICEDSRLGSGDEDVDVEEEDEDEEEEQEMSQKESKTMGQVFGTFEIKNGSSGSESALEELFSDVDASYYDLDTMLTGMQSTPKIGPYDLLDNLGPSHGPTSIGSTANCRSDLNELDHIMEIIVGS